MCHASQRSLKADCTDFNFSVLGGPSACSEFSFGGGGVASRVPWGWRDSYGKTEILAGWVTKICLKCTKKLG